MGKDKSTATDFARLFDLQVRWWGADPSGMRQVNVALLHIISMTGRSQCHDKGSEDRRHQQSEIAKPQDAAAPFRSTHRAH
jgi:hypothetical protein